MKSQVQSCSRIAAVTGMRGLGAGTILSIVDSEMILILWVNLGFLQNSHGHREGGWPARGNPRSGDCLS